MGPITTCELLNDTGSPASETFVIFSPSIYFNCSHNLVTALDKLPEIYRHFPQSRAGSSVLHEQPHQRWVTAPWRINKQAPQRLSKTKREDNKHFALFLTTFLLSCTPKTSDLCPLLSCCHGEGPIHNPFCSEESLNY